MVCRGADDGLNGFGNQGSGRVVNAKEDVQLAGEIEASLILRGGLGPNNDHTTPGKFLPQK